MKRFLIVIAAAVTLTFAGMFLPRAEVSLEPFGALPLSVGSGIAYASPDEKTFYFNAYNAGVEEWKTNPGNMIDNDTGSYASTKTTGGEVQALTGNNCTALDESGAITAVELRCYAYRDGDDQIYLRPVFGGTTDGDDYIVTLGASGGWSGYHDITADTNAPASWAWADVQGLDCDVEYVVVGKDDVYCSKVEIRVTYTLVSITITAPTGETDLVLTPATNDQSLITSTGSVTSNVNFDVTARDNMADSKDAGDAGYLTEWTGAAWVNGSKLTNAVTVWSTHANAVGSEITLTDSDQDVILNGTSGTDVDLLLITQQDTAAGDECLTESGHYYKIVITFTASQAT